jgi:hypothetical protein
MIFLIFNYLFMGGPETFIINVFTPEWIPTHCLINLFTQKILQVHPGKETNRQCY